MTDLQNLTRNTYRRNYERLCALVGDPARLLRSGSIGVMGYHVMIDCMDRETATFAWRREIGPWSTTTFVVDFANREVRCIDRVCPKLGWRFDGLGVDNYLASELRRVTPRTRRRRVATLSHMKEAA